MTFRPAKTSIFFDARLIPRSTRVPGEEPPPGELRPGELGTNQVDGSPFIGKADGTAVRFPVTNGVRQIVKLSQAEYDALVSAGQVDAATLYLVT